MAYSDLPSKSSGDVFGLSEYEQIRDNFDAGVPDIFSAKGDLAAATGADAAARVVVGDDDAILVADSGQSAGLAWQIQPAVVAYNSTSQDPAVGSWHTLAWDSESVDTDGMHSTVSDTSRLTVPTGGAGIYLVMANVVFDTLSVTAGEPGSYGVRLIVNGTTVYRTVFDEMEASAHHELALHMAGFIELGEGQYVECEVYTSQDIDMTEACRFEAMWQRRPE